MNIFYLMWCIKRSAHNSNGGREVLINPNCRKIKKRKYKRNFYLLVYVRIKYINRKGKLVKQTKFNNLKQKN